MKTYSRNPCFFPVLILFLASIITPAIAAPVDGKCLTAEGVWCMSPGFLPIHGSISDLVMDGGRGIDARDTASLVLGVAQPVKQVTAPITISLESSTLPDKSTLINGLTGGDTATGHSASGATRLVSGEGTIRFIEMDGGFFGIVTNDGENYRPDNLPAAMKINGTWIRFEGVVRASATDSGTWGIPISLISVSLPSEGFTATGTVRFIELEGGFFGIVTPAGDNYLPLNLPAEFQVNGIQVAFTAHEEKDASTTVMWGRPIRLDSISRFGQQAGDFGGLWSLIALDGEPLIPGTEITAFFSNGRVTGSAGCNQYFATYSTDGSMLEISTAGSTMMYCPSPEGANDQETSYLNLLPKASTWSLDEGRLVIRDMTGKEILVFVSGLAHEPEILIEYGRTGGSADLDDHLVLSSDGSGTLSRGDTTSSIQVPEPIMRYLITHIAAADFPSLSSRYPAPNDGPEYITYTLTCAGKTVVAEETGVPPALVSIINILDEIVGGSAQESRLPVFF
jgi:heat shock protein HslJ